MKYTVQLLAGDCGHMDTLSDIMCSCTQPLQVNKLWIHQRFTITCWHLLWITFTQWSLTFEHHWLMQQRVMFCWMTENTQDWMSSSQHNTSEKKKKKQGPSPYFNHQPLKENSRWNLVGKSSNFSYQLTDKNLVPESFKVYNSPFIIIFLKAEDVQFPEIHVTPKTISHGNSRK